MADQRNGYFGEGEDANMWIANMCPELGHVQQAVVDSARSFLQVMYGQYRENHDIVGFKEVRYGRAEIELLRACYPEAHFLLLVRNPLNTWNSTPRDWYESVEDWTAEWNESVMWFQIFAQIDSRCHLIRYEDLIRQEPATMAMLTETAQVSLEQAQSVLAHKLGSIHAGLSESEKDSICDLCREQMEALGYL